MNMRGVFRNLALLATVLSFVASAQAQTDIRHDATVDAIQRVMPCVVNVGTESLMEVRDTAEEMFRQFYGYSPHGPRYQIQSSLGSGVIIDPEGYILTNEHVVRRAQRIQIKLSEEAGGQEYEAEYVSGLGTSDIALLKIKDKSRKFCAIKFAKDDDLLLGETVLALGNPFGLGGSVSRGILSSKRRATPKENEELTIANWLQTDASINPGNSGGPIINMRGELIGLSEAMLPGAQGIGFAIPVKEIRSALAKVFVPESNSRWFGAQVRPDTSPLLVESVDTNSPAANAGLKAGDVVLKINDKTPQGFEFQRLLRDDPASSFTLTIERQGERKTLNVRLVSFLELLRRRLGIDAQELTRDLARQFGVNEHDGLLISAVEKSGPAERAQLQRYFLITAIDNQRVHRMWDLGSAINQRKKDDVVELWVQIPQTRGDEIVGYRQGITQLKLR